QPAPRSTSPVLVGLLVLVAVGAGAGITWKLTRSDAQQHVRDESNGIATPATGPSGDAIPSAPVVLPSATVTVAASTSASAKKPPRPPSYPTKHPPDDDDGLGITIKH
ncbi:MAG: hypothetical protein KC766_26740, partial [Myxococcales bacterium]|nr:hypothetical protein [Myxococcales bacterium]